MKRTKEEISLNMSRIHSKDTKPEMILRRACYKKGLRYFIHSPKVLGHPDMFFKKAKVLVFIDGDFWHGHDFANRQADLKSHRSYWIKKIERNITRDRDYTLKLEADGYTVIRLWESDIEKDPSRCADIVYQAVKESLSPYNSDEEN